MNNTLIWFSLGITSAFFASLVAIFGKLGIEGLDSTLATMVRTLIMAIFLMLVTISLNKISLIRTIDLRSFFFITLAGIAGSLSWLAYFLAMKYGTASRVAALDRLSIVFIVFLTPLIGEVLCWQKVVGAIILTIGAAMITLC